MVKFDCRQHPGCPSRARTPLGQRAFRVHDPDGHIVELGEPMPVVIHRLLGQGMTPAAVAKQTGMPLAIVEQVAATPV